MKYMFILTLALLLTACNEDDKNLKVVPKCEIKVDQEIRTKIFMQCIALAQKQPNSTTYNDTDEVVTACAGAAYRQALRKVCTDKTESIL